MKIYSININEIIHFDNLQVVPVSCVQKVC